MDIRVATSQDSENIRSVYLNAFPDSENEVVAKLAIDLLFEVTIPPTISLVAETNDVVVGHIAFSPVTFDTNKNLKGFILAPLAVKTNFQSCGTGSKLIKNGLQQLSEMGINILFVYGDPEYYGRFGFIADIASQYTPAYKLQYPFGWQALVLNEFGSVDSPDTIKCVTSLCDPGLW